jgi:hypothetical protein
MASCNPRRRRLDLSCRFCEPPLSHQSSSSRIYINTITSNCQRLERGKELQISLLALQEGRLPPIGCVGFDLRHTIYIPGKIESDEAFYNWLLYLFFISARNSQFFIRCKSSHLVIKYLKHLNHILQSSFSTLHTLIQTIHSCKT